MSTLVEYLKLKEKFILLHEEYIGYILYNGGEYTIIKFEYFEETVFKIIHATDYEIKDSLYIEDENDFRKWLMKTLKKYKTARPSKELKKYIDD